MRNIVHCKVALQALHGECIDKATLATGQELIGAVGHAQVKRGGRSDQHIGQVQEKGHFDWVIANRIRITSRLTKLPKLTSE